MGMHPGALERKEATTEKAPEAVIRDFMGAFGEYKAANDSRIKALETKGAADPLLTDKLTKIDGFFDKYEGLNQQITAASQKAAAIDAMNERFDRLETAFKRKGTGDGLETANRIPTWVKAVYNAYAVGVPNLPVEQQKSLNDVAGEFKALNIITDTAGGYLAPIEWVREIIKNVTEISPARQIVRVRQTANKAINIPSRTGQFAAVRVIEGGTKSETTGLSYGMHELTAPEMYALIDITNDMMEDSAFDMQGEIEGESNEQFAALEGREFCTGTGLGQMEGILVSAGIQAIPSGAATTITSNGIINLKYALKTDYVKNAMFLLNRQGLGSVRKLVDLNGAYIWAPGIAQGRPNTIDGDPYLEFPDMPNEGAGTFPMAYGDFRRGYTMLDRIAMDMLRDPFTQATTGKIRLVFRKRTGGKVVLAEAIKKMICQ